MKNLLYALLTIGLVLTTAACGDNKKDKSRNLRRGGPGTGQVPGPLLDRAGNGPSFNASCGQIPANINLNGFLVNSNASNFDSELRAFLGTIGNADRNDPCTDPNSLCLKEVSGQCGATTGVRFAGQQVQTSAPVRVGQPNNASVTSGLLHMVVFDELAYQTRNEPEDERIPGVGVTFRTSGTVQGNSVQLRLDWECGTLQYNALIQSNGFMEGDLSFANNGSSSGRCLNNRSGTLGRLNMPVCHPQFGLFVNCG